MDFYRQNQSFEGAKASPFGGFRVEGPQVEVRKYGFAREKQRFEGARQMPVFRDSFLGAVS